uniref:PRC-barrel domain-containing protein n=1 Tax=candidate division CPR3 bacterium TaxID=2268181 RepID=A0A7C4R4W5_UNCC3
MLIHAKKLIGLPIIESITSKKIGFIKDVIVDPDNGKVLGVEIKRRYFGEKNKILMFQDVTDIYLDGVLTLSSDNLINFDEVIRVKEIFSKKICFLKSLVTTQNNKKLGYLDDFIFDTSAFMVTTMVVKKNWSNQIRIISAERILNIIPGRIIIRDISSKVRVSSKNSILKPILPI